MDGDPAKMTDQELQVFIAQMQSRDQAEARELQLLQAMNVDLCDRLQRLRTECVSSIRLIPDGSEKILGCTGQFADNGTVANKIHVNVSAPGNYVLQADKTFASRAFTSGGSDIVFESIGDKTAKSPRFLDLSSLRIASATGELMPPKASVGFELSVNETVIFKNTDLVEADDKSNKYYKVNPEVILAIQKSPACKVTVDEIQAIRDKVTASINGQTLQQNAPVANQSQQQ
jgi:hypothetical protein